MKLRKLSLVLVSSLIIFSACGNSNDANSSPADTSSLNPDAGDIDPEVAPTGTRKSTHEADPSTTPDTSQASTNH